MKSVEIILDLEMFIDSELNMRVHIGLSVLSPSTHNTPTTVFINKLTASHAEQPAVTVVQLKRVMYAAVRLVAGLGPRDHVTKNLRN